MPEGAVASLYPVKSGLMVVPIIRANFLPLEIPACISRLNRGLLLYLQ